MEDEEKEEDEATELWEESSLKSDFMEWTMDKAMAAFTCPRLGERLVERTGIFSLQVYDFNFKLAQSRKRIWQIASRIDCPRD